MGEADAMGEAEAMGGAKAMGGAEAEAMAMVPKIHLKIRRFQRYYIHIDFYLVKS